MIDAVVELPCGGFGVVSKRAVARILHFVGAIGVASQHSTSIIEVSLEWHFDNGALGCLSLPKSFIIKETTGLS